MKDAQALANDTAMGSLGRISRLEDLPPDSKLIGYIREASKLNERGIKLPKARSASSQKLEVPEYFLKAIKNNKRAHETFQGFSNSHKKEYVEWVTEAKMEETRNRRLATAVEWLSEGKTRHWKYKR